MKKRSLDGGAGRYPATDNPTRRRDLRIVQPVRAVN